ncbi:MAG: radical SAM protein [Desulfobacteraceae bacterium]
MGYIFGPVPSRRLGLSLGVDLVPKKTCSFDCIYCQVGRTTRLTATPTDLHPVDRVLAELRERLKEVTPDAVTLSGSGEPTLHKGIGRVIASVKEMTDTPVVLLTNGSLLSREEVRARVKDADRVAPTLCSVHEATFRRIHRPHRSLRSMEVIDGLKRFRSEYAGRLTLEVFLLKGINDTPEELEGLRRCITEISPDSVQLNTVARPPSERTALPLDSQRLEEIREFLGERVEVIADYRGRRRSRRRKTLDETVREMVGRRPVRLKDIAETLGIGLEETQRVVEGLELAGSVKTETHQGETYYLSGSKEGRPGDSPG